MPGEHDLRRSRFSPLLWPLAPNPSVRVDAEGVHLRFGVMGRADIPHERIDIELAFHEDHLEIRLVDYGTFVDPEKIKSRDLADVRPGGLGVHLMQSVMDEVLYEKNDAGGTTLIMRKRIPEAPEEGDFL